MKKTFGKDGGRLYCCTDCDDYLDIPAGAIAAYDQYEVEQQFPFICGQNETQSEYRIMCVKEYNEINNRSFNTHVKIVAHFTPVFDCHRIRVRHGKCHGKYSNVPPLNESERHSLFDTYFTVTDNSVQIFTKNFCQFLYEEAKTEEHSWFPSFIRPKCPKVRNVELVASAYYNVNFEYKILRVYIFDMALNKKTKNLMKNTRSREEDELSNKFYFHETLNNLPETINKFTKFQCVVFISRQKWQKSFGQEVLIL